MTDCPHRAGVQAPSGALSLLESGLRATPMLLAETLAVVWRVAEGRRCRNCGKPIRLSPGSGEPYWYHPDGHSSVWCDGWGDPGGTGRQAEPAS
jgi:hypothetical protein